MMRVYIRVDASRYIGSGHVMRCLTLADSLKLRCVDVQFICRDLPGHLHRVIEERGHTVNILLFDMGVSEYQLEKYSEEYAFWLGVPWQQDAQETLMKVKGECDLLIVDHYGLDARWENRCKEKCKKICVIDDLANREHNCDFLLDHNFYVDAEVRYADLVPEPCVQLCGAQYALIRPEVISMREWRRKNHSVKKSLQRSCLVFMGGSDASNYSQLVVAALIQSIPDISLRLVLGASNPHVARLEEYCRQKDQVEVFVQPENYLELLAEADYIVGAGGVSTLERFCLGLPSFVFQVADNQRETCLNLYESKAAVFFGNLKDDDVLNKLVILNQLSEKKLCSMGQAGMQLVDGLGVERVMEQLL